METRSNNYFQTIIPLPIINSDFVDTPSYSLSNLEQLLNERGEDFANHVDFCGYIPLSPKNLDQ